MPQSSDASPALVAATQPWGYAPVDGHHDEAFGTAAPGPRASWQPMLSSLADMGVEELQRRWEQAQRLIEENGVTYNLYGDAGGLDRPWRLDPAPLIVAAEEWRRIETAVIQRARLLDQVLLECHRSHRLLTDRLLPPELIFAHSGFLRPMHGVTPAGGHHLQLYAADLARSPNGQWWVVGDRTQAPAGAGYVLENRLVMSRVLPETFRECGVQRLAAFFARVQEMLIRIAPNHRNNPRIVLLTPGPFNEAYFEHAFLSRYLGVTLVQGDDLTVRDQRVYLKTLSGLLPVDVILRRQDDAFCDPLELREDSMLGVAGLVQAVRAGHVAVANALGSGLVESPALMAFLPTLCDRLLGESLAMPSVATWWCGQPAALEHVLSHMDQVVIRDAFGAIGQQPVDPAQLDAAQRRQLRDRLRDQPYHFVAQERVPLSTAPSWIDRQLQPRHILLRVYAVATADGGYEVMPGGMTHVSTSADSAIASMQRSGGSKDTWVIADGPIHRLSLLPGSSGRAELSRAGFALPSRVADNLYWLGRYAERTESTVRLLRCVLDQMTTDTSIVETPTIMALIQLLVAQGRPLDTLTNGEPMDPARTEDTLHRMMFDEKEAGSVRGDVSRCLRLGAAVRDRISPDSYRVLARLEDEFVSPTVAPALRLSATLSLLDDALFTLTAFGGQVMEGMTRERGWRLLDAGRRIERAFNLVALLRYALTPATAAGDAGEHETERLALALQIANSLMTYRSRYLASAQAAPVLDLLMLDEANPRSVAYQLMLLDEHVRELIHDPATRRPTEQRIAMELLTRVRLSDASELARRDEDGQRDKLANLLQSVTEDLRHLSDELSRRYLTYARASRQTVGLHREMLP